MERGWAGNLSYTPVWEPDPPTPPHHPAAGTSCVQFGKEGLWARSAVLQRRAVSCWPPCHSTEGGWWALRSRFRGRTWVVGGAKGSRPRRGTFGACSTHCSTQGRVTSNCPISEHLLSVLEGRVCFCRDTCRMRQGGWPAGFTLSKEKRWGKKSRMALREAVTSAQGVGAHRARAPRGPFRGEKK